MRSTSALLSRSMYSPTTSRTFSTNQGSVESLNVPVRCGWRLNARQMRDTVDWLRPSSSASVRVLQCVASLVLVSSVRVTTTCTRASSIVRGRPERGSSSSPSSPRSAKRFRHVCTVGRQTPSLAQICALLSPSAAASTMRARVARAWAVFLRRVQRLSSSRSCSANSIVIAAGPAMPMPSVTGCHRTSAPRHAQGYFRLGTLAYVVRSLSARGGRQTAKCFAARERMCTPIAVCP